MTFSLVARCHDTGLFGVAISSSSPAVAARCSFAKAGVGAVASQNVTDPRLGPLTLERMAAGNSAADSIETVIKNTKYTDFRQLLAIDRMGNTSIHSGARSLGINAEFQTLNAAAAGNLLACSDIPKAMINSLQKNIGHLGDRLINALRAGLASGGEAGPLHSAGLLLVSEQDWPIADLRCDWTEECPIEAVAEAWEIYKPQMNDYVTRALTPHLAPSYGVSGDE